MPPSARTLLEGGQALLLGWEKPSSTSSPFGFTPRSRADNRDGAPLLYEGDGHLCTVAPTGAGKGRGVAIPNLLTYRGPVIAVDPKGEFFQVTARRRREMGQRVIALDPFRVAAARSDCLNPFDLFDLPGAVVDCDAEMLATLLAIGHHFQTDPFWNDTANGLLSGLIAHTATSAAPAERTLNKVRSWIYHEEMDYALASLLDAPGGISPLARDEIIAYLAHCSDRTRPSVRSTATSYLKALGSSCVAEALGRSTFDLQAVHKGEPLTIYIIIPPEKLESHRALLRLWVGTLLTAVARRQRIPRQRTLFLLDECAQLGTLPALRQAVTLLRGSGLQVWTFWQDLSQLRLLYPQDWQTMLNNSAVLQTFGLNSHLMCREWSDVLGIDAQLLGKTAAEDVALSVHGRGSLACRRADYLGDKVFAGMFEPNERFALHGRGEGRVVAV